MPDKASTIGKVYYDLETGFQSIAGTLAQASKLDPSITRQDVVDFLAAQEGRQKRKAGRNNSFVPSAPREQFQMDLVDFGDHRREVPGWKRYGLVAIDIFSKQAAVVPMEDKQSKTARQALDAVLRVLGQPAEVMTDEGSEFKSVFAKRLLDYYEIPHRVTRTPPIFVERFIRTLREKIQVRLDALGSRKWWRVLDAVLKQYNSTVHTTTEQKPNELASDLVSPDAVEDAKEAIESKAHFNRRYPGLKPGDLVKVIIKPGSIQQYKTGFVAWQARPRKVEELVPENGVVRYKLEGLSRPLMRHELLKISRVEPAPREALRAGLKRMVQGASS